MKHFAFLTFLLIQLTLKSEELQIFSSGGFKGIADEKGTVVVPPIYENLGWSNGDNRIIDETIGYLQNKRWGLLNVKEKKITDATYVSLEPFANEYFKAGITGRFSNLVFRGLIDNKGRIKIGFRYFSMEDLGDDRIKVSHYLNGSLSFGVINYEGEIVIPVEFGSLARLDDVLVAGNRIKKHLIFDLNGRKLLNVWIDDVTKVEGGYRILNEGKYGLIDDELSLKHDILYKSVSREGAVPFPKWELRKIDGQETRELFCDSITYHSDQDLLIANINNVTHILDASNELFENQQHVLKHASNGYLVTQNTALGTWGIYKTSGEEVISGFDSIAVDTYYFYTQSEKGWDIYNLFGRKVNTRSYEAIGLSEGRNLLVKKTNYWGWLDFQGEIIHSFKYDTIISLSDEHFLAHYLNGWGVGRMNDVKWLVMPEFDSIYSYDQFYVAQKGYASYIFDQEGTKKVSVPYQVIPNGLLKIKEGEMYGAITTKGLMIDPEYEEVNRIDDFYELRSGDTLLLVNAYGKEIISASDRINDVVAFSEDYFLIEKGGKFGFVDLNGKLRIANRYDDALPYHEQLAPVKLLGKWGFIDKNEVIKIQPYYDNSTDFVNDLAVVQIENNYGIINKEGDEVIELRWKMIERMPTGNYVITDWDGKKGLVSSAGKFIVRANYESVVDTDQSLIIATRSSRTGVLDYNGYTKIPMIYSEIKIEGDYLIMLK